MLVAVKVDIWPETAHDQSVATAVASQATRSPSVPVQLMKGNVLFAERKGISRPIVLRGGRGEGDGERSFGSVRAFEGPAWHGLSTQKLSIRIHASEALIAIVSGALPAPACLGDDHSKRTGTAPI